MHKTNISATISSIRLCTILLLKEMDLITAKDACDAKQGPKPPLVTLRLILRLGMRLTFLCHDQRQIVERQDDKTLVFATGL